MDLQLEASLLSSAAHELSQRGLRVGARWALELVGGLTAEGGATLAGAAPVPAPLCAPSAPLSPPDESVFQLARLYLENREFARAAHLLDRHFAPDGAPPGPPAYPPRAFFLRCYALYLDGERRREMQRAESSSDVLLARGGGAPSGGALAGDLSSEVHRYGEALAAARGVGGVGPARLAAADPFLAYLQGVLLKAAGAREEARGALLHAAVAWPLNWSAWADLAACCGSKAEVDAAAAAAVAVAAEGGRGGGAPPQSLPADAWVLALFRGHALLAVHARTAALAALQPVSALFPRAPLLKSLVARALYGLRRFDAARALLEDLRAADPHRLDDADTLSNILYVAGARAPLAALAADAWSGDRYRPEACVAVGNFYALRGDHEKAVASFRRALRVDAGYATAWTLLGHEFVELRNLPAAMESYRRAVDVDSKDYRAWYGLGQAFELMGLSLYAAYYFKRAAALRPHDSRMWTALAACYEALERRGDAIACYERAAVEAEATGESGGGEGSSGAGEALLKLARLHAGYEGGAAAAQQCYARFCRTVGEAGGGGGAASDAAEAFLFLAKAAVREGRLEAAETYALKVVGLQGGGGAEEREARALLAQLREDAAAELDEISGGMDLSGP